MEHNRIVYKPGAPLCAKCGMTRTRRTVNFVASLFVHPALRSIIGAWSFTIPLCDTCERLHELPVMDATNGEVLDWRPTREVIAPNTEVVYI